jgi:hypothetical protein
LPTALKVEAATPGRKRAGTALHEVDIDLEPGPVTLRALIDAVVRAEVVRFRQRAEEQTFVRVLTDRALAEGLQSGAVLSGGREAAVEVDEDAAVAAALLAQEDGLYQVLVDDEPVDSLDDVVQFGEQTRLLFLRLVPLSGG